MTITQVSTITHRTGFSEDIPQLDGAELGWAIDARRLYIGNGDLGEGAPAIGNTEILTQHSDVLAMANAYTYKGTAAGYTVISGTSPNAPVARPIQNKFDDFASVKDFGAVGDGSVDDTDAINRALYELFCREINPEVRRSLYMPAGVYKVTDTIKIPPYAKIWGDGLNSTVIKYYETGNNAECVVRTADSDHQINADIGNNNAIIPTNIELSSISVESTATNDILYLQNVTESYLDSIALKGNLGLVDLNTSADSTAAIRVKSTSTHVSGMVAMDKCLVSNCTYGMHIDDLCNGVNIANSKFGTLYKGIVLGENPSNGGPKGLRITHNLFDDIFAQGIEVVESSFTISAFNMFYDVANGFQGMGSPATYIIDFQNYNNLSYGDMFERPDSDSGIFPRTHAEHGLTNYSSSDHAHCNQLGAYHIENGRSYVMLNNSTSPVTVYQIAVATVKTFSVQYTITRGNTIRSGAISVVAGYSAVPLSVVDDYTENSSTGVTLTVTQDPSYIKIEYTSTDTGQDGGISYQVSHI